MKPEGGVGGMRLMIPFCTWASTKQLGGTAAAGLEPDSIPLSVKFVILSSAATREARVGFWPALRRACTNSAADIQPSTPHRAIGVDASASLCHLSNSATSGTTAASSPRNSGVCDGRYIPFTAGPPLETSLPPYEATSTCTGLKLACWNSLAKVAP